MLLVRDGYALDGAGCTWGPGGCVHKKFVAAIRLTRIVCLAQMVVMTVGQMIKPENAVKSPMATDPGVTGEGGSAPSEGFTGMLADYQAVQQHTNNSLTKGYFMDGGALIAAYNGCGQQRAICCCMPAAPKRSCRDDDAPTLPAPLCSNILAGPTYSNNMASIQHAKDGCAADPAYAGLYGPHKPCKFVAVPGYNSDEEFVLAAPVSRGKVLASKLYQDNVGNYARTDIWEVKWHNKRRSYFSADKAAGNGLAPEEQDIGA